MFESSKKCKSVQTPPSMDLRLKLEISELLADVNDFLWQYHGRPQYVVRKLQFCTWTILKEDLDQTKALLDRAPKVEQLSKCRQLVMAQSSTENKHRIGQLERGIESVKKVKEHLIELVARVQSQLSSTGNISPTLSSVKSISAVKFATLGTSTNKPKSTAWQIRDSKGSNDKFSVSPSRSSSSKSFIANSPKLVIKLNVELPTKDDNEKQPAPVVEVQKTEFSKSSKTGAQQGSDSASGKQLRF